MLGSMQTVLPAPRRGGWLLAAAAAIGLLSVPLVSFNQPLQALADDPAKGAKPEGAQPGARPKTPPEKEFLPLPTAAEQKMLEVLDEPTLMDFHQAPFQDVIDFLKDKHSIEIHLDEAALEEAGFESDTPVTAHFKNVSLRSALSLLLKQMQLTWAIRDEVLLITTLDVADSLLITRTYPVGDLDGDADFDSLRQAITGTVSPISWDEVGGPGTIVIVPGSQSLVVSQTRPVHEAILTLLRSLRSARASQGPPPTRPPGEVKPASARRSRMVGGGNVPSGSVATPRGGGGGAPTSSTDKQPTNPDGK